MTRSRRPTPPLADVRYEFEWNWPGAEQGFRKALSLDPNSATAHQWYSNYLSLARRFDESFREIATARRLDPLNIMIRTDEGLAQHFAGHEEQAAKLLNETIQMASPGFPSRTSIWRWSSPGEGLSNGHSRKADPRGGCPMGIPTRSRSADTSPRGAATERKPNEALRELEELSRRRFVSASRGRSLRSEWVRKIRPSRRRHTRKGPADSSTSTSSRRSTRFEMIPGF